MKVLMNFSRALQRYANLKYILITLGFFIAMVVFMEVSPTSSRELKALSMGTGMLDMHFSYSQQKAYSMLDSIGEYGRFVYTVLLGIDFLFAVAFMLFQSLIITSLMRRIELPKCLGILNLLPFFRSGLDMLENSILFVMILCYPIKLPAAVAMANVFTISKWVVYYVLIALLIILGAILTYQNQFSKRR